MEQLALEFGEAKAERRRKRDEKITVRWRAFHAAHPEFYALFVQYAVAERAKGRKRFGAKWIMEQIRWNHGFDGSEKGKKVQDHFTSRYVRLFLSEHPDFKGFFELRELRSE
jgi:hypothetical protein